MMPGWLTASWSSWLKFAFSMMISLSFLCYLRLCSGVIVT